MAGRSSFARRHAGTAALAMSFMVNGVRVNDAPSNAVHRARPGLAGKTVLVVGVTGFIGAAVACRLHGAGAAIIGVSRATPRSATPLRHVRLDIARAADPAVWRSH